jgi:tetratricopeptide (TPR) repeat protein
MDNDLVDSANASPQEAHGQPAGNGDGQQLCKQGVTAYLQGNYSDAVTKLNEGLTDDRENWKAMVCLALSYCHCYRFKAAQSTFEHLAQNCEDLDIQSRCINALDRLQKAAQQGTVSLDEADTDELPTVAAQAQGSSLAAPVSDEERAKYRKWGTNSYLDNKYEKAIEYLELGLSADVQDDMARFCLGMSYFKVGNYEPAKNIFNGILKDCTDNKIRARVRQGLDSVLAAEIEPVPLTEEEKAAQEAARAAAAATKRKARKDSPQLILHEEEEVSAPSAKRRTHPLALVVILLGLLGGAYYACMMMLPRIYASLLIPKSISAKSVQTFGPIEGVEGLVADIPAANNSRLYGVYYAKRGVSRAVILNPGLDDDFEFRKKLAQDLLRAGFGVLVYDVHGTGGSNGTPTWQNMDSDGRFAYDYLVGKFGYKGPDISSYGRGWGAASALFTVASSPHGSAVVEDPFTSVPNLTRAKQPLLALFPDATCPNPHMDMSALFSSSSRQHAPLLVLMSNNDLVPASDTQLFFQNATEPKKLEQAAGGDDSKIDTIVKFLSNN